MIFLQRAETSLVGVPHIQTPHNSSLFVQTLEYVHNNKIHLMKIIKYLVSVQFLFVSIAFSSFVVSEVSEAEMSLLENLPPDQRESILMKMRQADELGEELEETFEKIKTFTDRPKKKTLSEQEMVEYERKSRNWVFGYEQFQSSPTTFAPASNIPVPPNFTLGPGDKLSIEYLGNDEAKVMAYISRAGTFNLPLIGPVALAGLTFSEAKTLIKEKVASKLIGTEVFISLTETRSVTVYVLGEAYKPGAYTVSSLYNAYDAYTAYAAYTAFAAYITNAEYPA